jgi:hypothetical protein
MRRWVSTEDEREAGGIDEVYADPLGDEAVGYYLDEGEAVGSDSETTQAFDEAGQHQAAEVSRQLDRRFDDAFGPDQQPQPQPNGYPPGTSPEELAYQTVINAQQKQQQQQQQVPQAPARAAVTEVSDATYRDIENLFEQPEEEAPRPVRRAAPIVRLQNMTTALERQQPEEESSSAGTFLVGGVLGFLTGMAVGYTLGRKRRSV